jgi:hypothetical protein
MFTKEVQPCLPKEHDKVMELAKNLGFKLLAIFSNLQPLLARDFIL